MKVSDLDDFLRKSELWHRFIKKGETIHTADAARVSGVDLNRLTKNLVAKTDNDKYVILIVPGNLRVNLKATAEALKVCQLRLVSFDQAEKISGYQPGGTPSIGHKITMQTIIDESLLQYETIYCGGGSRKYLLELKTEDIVELSKAVTADISTT